MPILKIDVLAVMKFIYLPKEKLELCLKVKREVQLKLKV
jgi:hypothetical protein